MRKRIVECGLRVVDLVGHSGGGGVLHGCTDAGGGCGAMWEEVPTVRADRSGKGDMGKGVGGRGYEMGVRDGRTGTKWSIN